MKLKIDDKVTNDPQTMANNFNKVFTDKINKLREETGRDPSIDPKERLRDFLAQRDEPLPEFELKPIDLDKLK